MPSSPTKTTASFAVPASRGQQLRGLYSCDLTTGGTASYYGPNPERHIHGRQRRDHQHGRT